MMACRGRFRPAWHFPPLTLRGPVGPQRGPVTNEPQAEGIDEAALPVDTPRRLVVAYLVDGAVRPSRYRRLDEAVGVVGEHLDPNRP
jgi:hypothetical protein